MFRVFNMGIGLVAIVPAERLAAARRAVPTAIIIGQIERREDREAVVLRGVA
jgi:phosphoribosylaminoimidazole (AIR) synthetase